MTDLNEWAWLIAGCLVRGSLFGVTVFAIVAVLIQRWPAAAQLGCWMLRGTGLTLFVYFLAHFVIWPAPPQTGQHPTGIPVPLAWLLFLWVGGLGCFGYSVYWERRIRDEILGACVRVKDEAILRLYDGLCRELEIEIDRRPILLHCQLELTPSLIGFNDSSIILPSWLLGSLDELRLVLAHELVHVRRRDVYWKWLLLAIQIVYPFSWLAPINKWLNREWEAAQEFACDSEVLAAAPIRRSAYLAVLARIQLKAAELVPVRFSVAAGALICQRIRALSCVEPTPPLVPGSACALVAVAAIAFLTQVPHSDAAATGQAVANPPPSQLQASERKSKTVKPRWLPPVQERHTSLPQGHDRIPVSLVRDDVAVRSEPRDDAPVLARLPFKTSGIQIQGAYNAKGDLRLLEWRVGWVIVDWLNDDPDNLGFPAGWVWGGDLFEPLHQPMLVTRDVAVGKHRLTRGQTVVASADARYRWFGKSRASFSVLLSSGATANVPRDCLVPAKGPMTAPGGTVPGL